ncbi:MAG: hypothetical protein ABSG89_11370 [Bacteroidales bacterium]|jgi:hypothetical protein
MKDSFYYFFSTVPQVLGGVMALFGVFVIFRIQSIKEQMYLYGKEIMSDFNYKFLAIDRSENNKETIKKIFSETYDTLGDCVQLKDFNMMYKIYSNFRKVYTTIDYGLLNYEKGFFQLYTTFRFLINWAIISSITTGITILFCISLIPYEKDLINNQWLLQKIYLLTVILAVIVFILLIIILIVALKEKKIKYNNL